MERTACNHLEGDGNSVEYLRTEYKGTCGHLLREREVGGFFCLRFSKQTNCYKQGLFKVCIREQNPAPRSSLATYFTTSVNIGAQTTCLVFMNLFIFLTPFNHPQFIYFQSNAASFSSPG